MSHSEKRIDRRRLLKSGGVAAAVGLAGCGGDGGDGDSGDTGGDTPTESGSGGGGATPTEQGPSDRSEPYLDKLPEYYPESYWRTIDGAMDESGQEYYTSYFGALAQHTVAGFNEVFDFIDWNITSLGTAEVYTRYTTEASRGQVNPDVIFTYDPIAMRQLYVADLVENYVSPNVSETDAWLDRYLSDIEGLVMQHAIFLCHSWNPKVYAEAGVEEPGDHHTLDWWTDHMADNPDFYTGNTCVYDTITSTSGWQQMDFYGAEFGDDWVRDQYETIAEYDPRAFWSTSTMGEWIANGEVAYGMGMSTWIIARFFADEFDIGEDVTWGKHTNTPARTPNHQVTANADNPNSGRLFADWALSPHGNAWTARDWFIAPANTNIPEDELAVDPVWEEPVSEKSIRDGPITTIGDSIWMSFEERTTRSQQKSKYKDMWYDIFS
jgi:ABC-type Fe3+ transport system substrate-binding protein